MRGSPRLASRSGEPFGKPLFFNGLLAARCQGQHIMNHRSNLALALVFLPGLLGSCQSTEFEDRTGFESAEAAVDAVIAALRADDVARLKELLGPGSDGLFDSGDEVDDRIRRERFLERFSEGHSIETDGAGTSVLYVGELEWPFPIPIVQSDDRWFLDTEEGREEIIDRRVGGNELTTQKVCMALVDAELDYAARDWDGDGVFEYAQKIRSAPGKKDGLYWETTDGELPSPVGELIAAAEEAGHKLRDVSDGSFHGYRYRLLTEQGPSATGGAYSYMAGDSLLGGFAVVAFPTRHGDSGVMTFLVGHDGVVYEKNLGPDSETLAKAMIAFDPDDTWRVVSVE